MQMQACLFDGQVKASLRQEHADGQMNPKTLENTKFFSFDHMGKREKFLDK